MSDETISMNVALTRLNRLYLDMKAAMLHPGNINRPKIIIDIDGSGYAEISYYDGQQGFHCCWGNLSFMPNAIYEAAKIALARRQGTMP